MTDCECSDPGCPVHEGSDCSKAACDGIRLYRVDTDDEFGLWFCDQCADDALESGVFTTRVDM